MAPQEQYTSGMDLTNNEWKKPDPEVYILYDSSILSSKTSKTHLWC